MMSQVASVEHDAATPTPLVSATPRVDQDPGAVLVATRPIESRAMHEVVRWTQVMLAIEWLEIATVFQLCPPFQVATRPSRLPATQKVVRVHEMVWPGTLAVNTTLDVSELPSQNHTVPFCEIAAQKVLFTHETPLMATVCTGVVTGADQAEPVKDTKSPPALAAKQYVGEVQDTVSSGGVVGTAAVGVDEVHDTPIGLLRPVAIGDDQDPSVRMKALPSLLSTTQLAGVAQEIATSVPDGTSTAPSAAQVVGLPAAQE